MRVRKIDIQFKYLPDIIIIGHLYVVIDVDTYIKV